MSKKFIIGTRGSLLAVTQCTLIKNLLEQKTGKQFELKTIKTQGDQITDKPLWQLDGKDFFTKELDAALLTDQVDLVVHSYKDLGSQRPEGITLGAITKREFANDILLIKKDTIKNIKNMDEFIVGTSSPRRIENITSSIDEYLPELKPEARIRCEVLRGNVNGRIQKMLDGNYDAIVLAMAGLERLASYPESKEVLKDLIKDLDFLILPQRDFPSSASQGALAIEYHQNGPMAQEIASILKTVHCDQSEKEISVERKAFAGYGGGCHLAVGIYVKEVKQKLIQIEKGIHHDQKILKSLILDLEMNEIKNKKSFLVLSSSDKLTDQAPIKNEVPKGSHLFVTSKYCIHNLKKDNANTLWAAGTRTAKELVRSGYWVNGVCDFSGHDELIELKNSHLINLFNENEWNVLSHKNAKSEVGAVISCYAREIKGEINPEIFNCDVIYWGSFEQYLNYIQMAPELQKKIHTCGLGMTYQKFLENKISVTPIVNMKEFKDITKVTK